MLIVCLVGASAVSSVRAEQAKIALLGIEPLAVDKAIAERLEGLLRMELERLVNIPDPGKLQIERFRRGARLKACSGALSCLADHGKLLGVDRVVVGNVGALGDHYVVNLKVVDIKERRVIRRVQETLTGDPNQLIDTVRVALYRAIAPERVKGALQVLANEAAAEVYLDGLLLGRTPLPIQSGINAGEHALRVRKSGYSDAIRSVVVPFQKTASVAVRLDAPRDKEGRVTQRPVPWYTRWWFWSAVSVLAVATGTGVGLLIGEEKGINCATDPARCGL